MANYSEFDSAISRGQDGAASNDAGQLDSAGQAILKLLHKAADTAEANSRHALERRKSSQVNSKLRKIELRRWSRRVGTIGRRRSAPKSGSTKFLRRLRIASLTRQKRSDNKCFGDHRAALRASISGL
jgi:hypothetical protein